MVDLYQVLVYGMADAPIFLIPAYLVYTWLRGDQKDSFFIFSSVVLAWGLSYVIGLFYYHPVPYGGTENAFPSQHTTAMFTALWAVLYQERYRFGAVLGVGGALTGVGRVLANYHYPVDILGGVFASAVGFGLAYLVEDHLRDLGGYFEMVDKRLRRIIPYF